MPPYKQAKEAFVSQLQGGSVATINTVSLTALTTYALWACLRSRRLLVDDVQRPTTPPLRSSHRLAWAGRTWWAELVILVVPIILAVTVLSGHLLALNGVLVVACAVVLHSHPAAVAVGARQEKRHERHWSRRDSDSDSDGVGGIDDEGDGQARRAPQEHTGREDPLRISVDSAADAARASAAPPTAFVPPGVVDGGSYSSHSSRTSSESGQGMRRTRSPAASSLPSPLHRGSLADVAAHSTDPPAVPLLAAPSKAPISSNYVPRDQPFLSVYRAHMMLMTIVCILAVDFPAFPRQFAKCETWGTSLMDLGVGSFVLSMGIVSALPLLRSPRNRFKPLRAQLFRDVRRSVPLLVLGAVRVIMVKGVEYPEHVSEYGVHWNFFITLALLPLFGTLCRPLARFARYSLLGLLLSCVHQVALSWTDLGAWTTSNDVPRTSLVSQNKEGLVSFPGYLALFLLGLDLGHYVLPRDPYLAHRRPSRSRKQEKTDKLAMLLASFSILWWAAYYADTLVLGGLVSRRLANLPYVLWVTAFNSTFLLCYVAVYMVLLQPLQAQGATQAESCTPLLLTSLNRASFLVFLAANLLTGLVNVSIHTMYTSHALALVILTLYTSLCLALATHAYIHGWRLPI